MILTKNSFFHKNLSLGKFKIDRIDGIVHNAATMEPTRTVNKVFIDHLHFNLK